MGYVSGSLGKVSAKLESLEFPIEDKIVVNKFGNVLIHRKRKCPKCGEYAARVQKTVKGKPVLICSKCKEFSYCEYKD